MYAVTKKVLGIAAGIAGAAFIGYCVYFNKKGRHDSNYKNIKPEMSANNCDRKRRRDRQPYKTSKTRWPRTSSTQMHQKVENHAANVTENVKVGNHLENVRDSQGTSLSTKNPRNKVIKTEEEGCYVSLYKIYLKYFLCCLTMISVLVTSVYLPVDLLLPNHDKSSFVFLRRMVPLICEYQNRFQIYINILFQLTLLTLGLLGIQLSYYLVMSRQETHARVVEKYFLAITKKLKQRAIEASETDERVVLLDLLRDEMIPPGQRKKEADKWNEALRVLEMFDRRIRFGVVTVNGIEVRTAEWMENVRENADEQSDKNY